VAGIAGVTGVPKTGVTHAALWTGTTTVDLGALAPLSSGSWSEATGINDSGQVVGYWALSETGTAHPWLYSNGTMTSLPEPSNLTSPSCMPGAFNNNGQIAGWGTTSTGATHGFLDSNGTVTDLGSFTPFALNDNGVMIDPSGPSIDSGGTVQNLNNLIASSGYQLNDAFAINDNGQIVGYTTGGQGVVLTPN
jgi:probable HAF family extracellular repeat protein